MYPVVWPVGAENKRWPEEILGNLDAQGYGKQGSFEEVYSQTPGGRGWGSPGPVGKELGCWRQARATGLEYAGPLRHNRSRPISALVPRLPRAASGLSISPHRLGAPPPASGSQVLDAGATG